MEYGLILHGTRTGEYYCKNMKYRIKIYIRDSQLNRPECLARFARSLIREYSSTLYVGLARAVSPSNTNFRLTYLLTRLQEALYEDLAV